MTDKTKHEFATQLAALFSQIDDLNIEAKALLEIAKERGIDTKALRKVAKEINMDSAKLADLYDAEGQLDLFRAEIGLFAQKGLDETQNASDAFRRLGEQRVEHAAAELDAIAGTDIANTHKRGMAAVRRMVAKQEREREAAE